MSKLHETVIQLIDKVERLQVEVKEIRKEYQTASSERSTLTILLKAEQAENAKLREIIDSIIWDDDFAGTTEGKELAIRIEALATQEKG